MYNLVGAATQSPRQFYENTLDRQYDAMAATRGWLRRSAAQAGLTGVREMSAAAPSWLTKPYNMPGTSGLGDMDWSGVLESAVSSAGGVLSSVLGKKPATNIIQAPAASATPAWLLPVGVGVGLFGLVYLLKKRRA